MAPPWRYRVLASAARLLSYLPHMLCCTQSRAPVNRMLYSTKHSARPSHLLPRFPLRQPTALLLGFAPAPPHPGHVTFFWNGNRSGYLDPKLEKFEEVWLGGEDCELGYAAAAATAAAATAALPAGPLYSPRCCVAPMLLCIPLAVAALPTDPIRPGHFIRQGASHEGGAAVQSWRQEVTVGGRGNGHGTGWRTQRCVAQITIHLLPHSERIKHSVPSNRQARESAKTTKQALLSGRYDFVRCNFANPGGWVVPNQQVCCCAMRAATQPT